VALLQTGNRIKLTSDKKVLFSGCISSDFSKHWMAANGLPKAKRHLPSL